MTRPAWLPRRFTWLVVPLLLGLLGAILLFVSTRLA